MMTIHNEMAALEKAERDMQARTHRDEAAAKARGDASAIIQVERNRQALRDVRAAMARIVPLHCPDLTAGLTAEEAAEAEAA